MGETKLTLDDDEDTFLVCFCERDKRTTPNPSVSLVRLTPFTVNIAMGRLPFTGNDHILNFRLHGPQMTLDFFLASIGTFSLALLTTFFQRKIHRLLHIYINKLRARTRSAIISGSPLTPLNYGFGQRQTLAPPPPATRSIPQRRQL